MSSNIVLATRNKDKVAEIRKLLTSVEILTLDAFPDAPEVVEDGDTLEENAIKKAKTIARFTGLPAVADDTGLEVDFLEGRPGVFSSRFAGKNASYDDNVEKLLGKLQGVPRENRRARFRCLAAIFNGTEVRTAEGVCEGFIAETRRGTNGFGYDPVFHVPEHDCTFAQMDLQLKNRISHRARAFAAMNEIIESGGFELTFRNGA